MTVPGSTRLVASSWMRRHDAVSARATEWNVPAPGKQVGMIRDQAAEPLERLVVFIGDSPAAHCQSEQFDGPEERVAVRGYMWVPTTCVTWADALPSAVSRPVLDEPI